jgi:hypothetical protein
LKHKFAGCIVRVEIHIQDAKRDDATVSDYAVLINGPWATQQRREDFDAEDAAARYGRMAEKTKDWGIAALTIQCWIARAVVLDEYLNDGEAALNVLDQAIAVFGAGALLLCEGKDLLAAR